MNRDTLTYEAFDDYAAADHTLPENAGTNGWPLALVGMAVTAGITLFAAKAAFYAAAMGTLGVALFVLALRPPFRRDMALRAVLMMFFTPVLAWLLPSVWLLYLAMLLWVPLFSGKLERIAGVYLFNVMLLPGLDTTFAPGGLKLFDVGVHDALAVGAAIAIYRNPLRARVAVSDDVRVGLLIAVVIFALARDTTLTHFLRTTINISLDCYLPYYILSRGLAAVDAMRSALRWLACTGAGLASVLIFEVWSWWPLYNELYWRHGIAMNILVKTRGAMLRAGGPFTEGTSMGLAMAMCLFALWLLRDDFRTRTAHWALCLLTFIGLSAPQSRNAWIGLGLAILLADIFAGRWAALMRKVVPAAALVCMVLVAAGTSPEVSESLGMSGQASDTADYRRNLLDRGTEEFWKSPVAGYSIPELEVRLNDLRQGEGIIDYVNAYLWFALVGGVIGLAIFVANMVVPLAHLWGLRRAVVEVDAAAPAAFMFGCIAMLCLTLFFTSFGGRPTIMAVGFFGFIAAIRTACAGLWYEAYEYPAPISGTQNSSGPQNNSGDAIAWRPPIGMLPQP